MSAALRLAMGPGPCRYGRHSHPPSPVAPRRDLYPSGDGEPQCP